MVQEYRKSLVDSLSGEYEPPEMQLPDFANPGVLAARIVENEERGKIVEQIARRKELGFGAVEKLLEQQPVIGSLDALIEAVANAKDNRVEEF